MDQATITIIILILAAGMLIWEKIPLALTAMITAISLVVFGVLTPAQGFAGFVNPNIIIFFSMFVVGGALFDTGAAARIGEIVLKMAKNERLAVILIFLVAGGTSGFLSNTGTAAIFIPITLGIAAKAGIAKSKLLMVMGIAANMGGGLTLIGTPPNLIVQSILEDNDLQTFGFFEFGIVGLPLLILTALYFYFIGYKYLPQIEDKEDDGLFNVAADYSHVPAWKRNASLIILFATVVGIMLEPFPIHIVSTIGAITVVLLKILTEKQAYKSVDFSTIFLFSGTLALATALEVSGAGELIANNFIGLVGEDASPMVLLVLILVLSTSLTQFMSNTAATAVLAPLAFSISLGMGADPRAVLMATAVGGTLAYLTPVGTPPLTMIYGIGGYRFKDYPKTGWPIMIIGFVVSIVMLPIFFPF